MGDDFAEELANCLKFNEILHTVDISENPISEKGANSIFKALSEANETLVSLGDLHT